MVIYNLQSKIKGAIRRIARYHPQTIECLNKSVHKTITGPRGGKMFECSGCHGVFQQIEVQVDHIDPVVPINIKTEDLDYNELVARMFCGADNLQVLCKECHNKKSKNERDERKKWRKSLK